MRKRIMSLVLVLVMVLALMPVFETQASAVNALWPVPGHTTWNQNVGLHGAYYNGVQYRNAIDISDGSINGATVVAAMGGTVTRKYTCEVQHYGSTEDCNGFGTGLVISGDDGKTYQYAHMQAGSIPSNVYVGAYVSRGQQIGKVGTTGNSTGPHLHFGISNTSKYWENGDPRPGYTVYDYIDDMTVNFYDHTCDASNISKVSILTKVSVNGGSMSSLTSAGVIFYDSHGTEINRKEEWDLNHTDTYMNLYYDIGPNQEINMTLNPGTVYQYKFFVRTSSKTFEDSVRSFTTPGSSVNLDVNGLLDGTSYGSLKDYGTVDVYVKGKLVANDVSDYCTSEHYGSTYEIKDIKAKDGYTYKGVASGSLTGTIYGSTVNVVLKFDKIDSFAPDSNSLPSDYYGLLVQASPWMHVNVNGDNMELADSTAYIPTHIFRYVEQSDGSYKIICEYDGRVLTASSNGSTAGTNVELAADYGWDGQRWFIHDNGDGTFVLTPKSNKDVALSVEGGASSVAGTNVRLWNRNGNAAQNFSPYILSQDVTYVKPSKPAASSVITTEAVPGTAVNIQWTPSPLVNAWDARTYMLTVKDSSGNIILAKTNLTGTSYSFTFPSAGTYTAQVIAVNTMYYDYMTVGTAGTITVKKTPQPNPFIDVTAGKFYYEPVLWAISQNPQITTGVTNTTFEPDRICTRAHVVTFLWRANGCPNPSNMTSNFKDVKDTSKYYYKAVLWASEKGITTGYSDGTFRPDAECTRGQVVTFLWRAKGQPAPSSASIPFSDVPAGKYYTTAVLWALQNNITKGRTATTFGPDDACTRGHVVTFLYRAYAD